MIEHAGFIGIVRTKTIDAKTLKVVAEKEYRNKINNYLLQSIVKWLTGGGAVIPPTQISLGNGIGTPAATDTGLWAPIAGTLKVADYIQVYQTYYAQYAHTYQATDPSGNFTEILLSDTNGNPWCHVAVNDYKSSSQLYTVQWQILCQGN